ncbi:MAG: flagellar export chaperone FliS [Spirochaetaceae bacterium]|nr:MAG: flagellar export chaperone FliS [Spirochaetaceae bacterium]
MSLRASSVSAYRETSVRTASGGKIIVMLYDEAIRQINSAVSMLDADTRALDKVNSSILKAQDIVTELMVSLDFEQGGEIADRLFGLYRYFIDQLVQANWQKDPEPLREISTMMSQLRDAWAQIVDTTRVEGRGSGGINVAG